MAHRVFLSYSTKDQVAAEAVCRALEQAGVPCWIAPRDIRPGTQWGGSIVEAIESAEAVLVLFSQASNDSPQVAREMEVAVAQRRPLIPVRIGDAMPTDDMKYFLGVSHWLNAYEHPINAYLPDIVTTTKRVLDKETGPLARVKRVLPKTRNGQLIAGGAAVVLVAVITASMMRSDPMRDFKMPENPMTGRWETTLKGANGREAECQFDVQPQGQLKFDDNCPEPFTGGSATMNTVAGNTWAPSLYHDGDDGTFLFQGGTLHGFSGAYRVSGHRMTTRDGQFGEIRWKKISSDEPMKNASDDILPEKADWPVSGLPKIAAKATAYIRSHWQSDAVLMSIKAELQTASPSYDKFHSPLGAVELTFSYYSPETQQGMSFTPTNSYAALYGMGAVDWDARRALPDNFLDLPQAVDQLKARGMRAKQISNAELSNWGSATYQADMTMRGLEWNIHSALDEYGHVPAALQ